MTSVLPADLIAREVIALPDENREVVANRDSRVSRANP
jgi:hypothetical protein